MAYRSMHGVWTPCRGIAGAAASCIIEVEGLPSLSTTQKYLRQLKHSPEAHIRDSDLDRDPWKLNVRNGTVDLRTGQLHHHDPDDLISKVAPVTYDPNQPYDWWVEVLHGCLRDDGLVVQVEREVAEAVTCSQHHLPVWCGPYVGHQLLESKVMASNVMRQVLGHDYTTRLWIELHPAVAGKQIGWVPDPAERRVVFVRNSSVLYRRYAHKVYYWRPPHTSVILLEETSEPWGDVTIPYVQVQYTYWRTYDPQVNLLNMMEPQKAGVLRWIVEACKRYYDDLMRAAAPAQQGCVDVPRVSTL